MTKNEIIEKWFREGVVQDIVKKYRRCCDSQKWDDLVQMIYLALLEKPEELIQQLNDTNTYRFYVARMIATQVKSNLGPWRWQVTRYSTLTTDYGGVMEKVFKHQEFPLNEELRRVYDEELDDDERIMCDIIMNCYGQTNHGKYQFIKEALNCDISVAKKKYDKLIKKLREEFGLNNNVW